MGFQQDFFWETLTANNINETQKPLVTFFWNSFRNVMKREEINYAQKHKLWAKWRWSHSLLILPRRTSFGSPDPPAHMMIILHFFWVFI